ncbi:hypothetical protein CAAN1_23S00210 [[Candida] anglica]|uniref:glucan endo-1,3-beta-D-glucosidase n=1 Tax=[Candida] anglica TaxID=148631 RepID=A0ABP0E9U2_9ASCO
MRSALLALCLSALPSVFASSSYGAIEFNNLGFDGYYRQVASISNEDTSECTCALSTDKTAFSGKNAPLNEGLSVHFRGPLVLSQFGYYVSPSFTHGSDSSGDWSRLAYYDADSSTAENVTFLTNAGTNSSCLGKALTYAGSDGISSAQNPTVLAKDTKIVSDQEYTIFSDVKCGSSGVNNDCGVYRNGIPAFHGYDGDIKMFLFEFEMPKETTVSKDEVSYFDMPAIWLLNARIPRTSQYPDNGNCSCWNSGCGEFDIFEVMNTTESSHLYSTIHDYQGTGDIENGLQADGYIPRDTTGSMKGGVVFDSTGTAVVFMSNSTSITGNITASDLNSWIKEAGTVVTDTLSSVAPAATSSTSKKSDGSSLSSKSFLSNIGFSVLSALYYLTI